MITGWEHLYRRVLIVAHMASPSEDDLADAEKRLASLDAAYSIDPSWCSEAIGKSIENARAQLLAQHLAQLWKKRAPILQEKAALEEELVGVQQQMLALREPLAAIDAQSAPYLKGLSADRVENYYWLFQRTFTLRIAPSKDAGVGSLLWAAKECKKHWKSYCSNRLVSEFVLNEFIAILNDTCPRCLACLDLAGASDWIIINKTGNRKDDANLILQRYRCLMFDADGMRVYDDDDVYGYEIAHEDDSFFNEGAEDYEEQEYEEAECEDYDYEDHDLDQEERFDEGSSFLRLCSLCEIRDTASECTHCGAALCSLCSEEYFDEVLPQRMSLCPACLRRLTRAD